MIRRRHPLAKLAAAAVLFLFVSVAESPASLAVIAVLALGALEPGPERISLLLRRMAPFALLAASMSWIYLIADNPAYRPIAGDGAPVAALVAGRIMTMGLLSMAALDGTRPGDLARAVEAAGVPRRWVYGVLAAVQFLPALADDYRMLRLLDLAAGRDTRLRRLLAGRTPDSFLILLAGALRRASAAALSMQMRGLNDRSQGGHWRHQPFAAADWCLCGAVVLIALTCGLALP